VVNTRECPSYVSLGGRLSRATDGSNVYFAEVLSPPLPRAVHRLGDLSCLTVLDPPPQSDGFGPTRSRAE
jgi:hypothetical protein